MMKRNALYRIVTLLMCSILTLGTPVYVLAETKEAAVSEEADVPESPEPSSEMSEPASEPEGESAPAPSEPTSEPASELAADSAPTSETAPTEVVTTEPVITEGGLATAGGITGQYAPGDKTVNINIVDAEKYMAEGYDANLCWAATAANMLQKSGYAQEAVNPATGQPFANEDEVFDYFRHCFTDNAGDPAYGIEYFVNGQYRLQDIDGVSQLKGDAYNGHLISGMDELPANSLNMYDQRDYNVSLLQAVGDIAGKAVGVWIRYWNLTDQGDQGGSFDTNAHWATLYDIVKDTANNITGILLVDSDNDPVIGRLDPSELSDEPATRAIRASNMSNSYTYYGLSANAVPTTEDELEIGYHEISGYGVYDQSGNLITRALLGALYVLDPFPANGGPDPGPENGGPANIPTDNPQIEDPRISSDEPKDVNDNENANEDSRNESASSPAAPNLETMAVNNTDQIMNYELIKEFMAANNIVMLSPDGDVYDKNTGTGYTLVIRRMYRALANVYVNGKRLPDNGKYYKCMETPNGMLVIVFTDEYLKSLGDGEYSIKMDFVGSDDLNSSLTIK